MRTDVRTVPPAEDVEHAGDVLVRRRWVQFARRPVSMIWSIQLSAGNGATVHGREYDRYRESPAGVMSWCQAAERSRRILEET